MLAMKEGLEVGRQEAAEMAKMLRQSSRGARRDQLVREFVETLSTRTSATPEELGYLIEAHLMDTTKVNMAGRYVGDYPSLLDLFDGDYEGAATAVRDHMVKCEQMGRATTLVLGCMDLEEIACSVVNR